MNALLTVLQKVIVQSFYRQNTGLFLVVLLLAGGFMRAPEHIALATYALFDPLLLAGYFLLWLLYAIYCTYFVRQVFRSNEVLLMLRLVPGWPRRAVLLASFLSILAPVLAYGGFMMGLGIGQNAPLTLSLGMGLLLLVILPIWAIESALRHPPRATFFDFAGAWVRERFTTPYSLFFIRYVWRQQPVLLLLTKGGACLLMAGVLALYPTDEYDIRLLLLGALLGAIFHFGIVYRLYEFEASQLLPLKNLPIPSLRRAGNYALILALLLLPEALILLRNNPASLSSVAVSSVWLFEFSLVLLQYSYLLIRHRSIDQHMPVVYWVLIGFFLLIMYRVPALLLLAVNLTVALFWINRYLYRSAWEITDD